MLTSDLHCDQHFYGVDFSGAANAGSHIWIAQGIVQAEALVITGCRQARDLTGGGVERAVALPALCSLIAAAGSAVFGMDFPFSLPERLIQQEAWQTFAEAFAETYPDAESFRAQCRALTDGRELKRRTDVETATPFCAYNLRMYRQTYYGIRDVLAPLVRDGAAAVLPMQRVIAGKPLLLEVCPAVLLKARGLYFPYKGPGAALMHARRDLLESLTADHRLRVPEELRDRLIADTHGDALDSVIAAYGAFLAAVADPTFATISPDYQLEGKVYP